MAPGSQYPLTAPPNFGGELKTIENVNNSCSMITNGNLADEFLGSNSAFEKDRLFQDPASRPDSLGNPFLS